MLSLLVMTKNKAGRIVNDRAGLLLIGAGMVVLTGCTGAEEFRRDPADIPPEAGPAREGSEQQRNADFTSDDLPELTDESTVNDYFQYALQNNESLRKAWKNWEAASERPRQARALPDPRISFQADDSFETRELAVSQTFPWYGKRALRAEAERSGALAEYSRYRAERLDVLNDVRNAYGDYSFLSEAIDITEENLDLLEYFQEVVRKRFEAGNTPHADLIRIEVETEKLRDRLENLRDQRGPRAAKLNRVLGRPHSAPLPWPVELPEKSITELRDSRLMESAIENNPRLLALRHRIDERGSQKDLAGKEYYPGITFSVMRMEEGMGGMSDDIDAAMISLNIPLWRDKYDAGVREADARLESGRRDLEDSEYRVEAELENALFNFRDAQRKIDLYDNYLLPKAEESLNVSESAYQAGNVDIIELLDAQRELLNFELELERARAERFKSIGEIEKLTGQTINAD